jgi:DNA (cytosine-5)-methyltransferase 1
MTSHRVRILDLFCGAGGAAMGYHRAGFDVVGARDWLDAPRHPRRDERYRPAVGA